MRAIVSTPQGPSRTERRDVAPPEPEPNEAVVGVRAFAVNRGELRLVGMRDGWQPGQDVAGEVLRAAADGSGPRAGERVAGLAEWHGWAEEAVVPAHRLAPGPDGVDLEGAAALPVAGTTAGQPRGPGGGPLGPRGLVTRGARGGRALPGQP